MSTSIQANKHSAGRPPQGTPEPVRSLNARVSEALLKALQKQCIDDGISQEEGVRRAVQMYLESKTVA